MNANRIRWAERLLGTAGILLLGASGFLYMDGSIHSRAALEELRAELQHSDPPAAVTAALAVPIHTDDVAAKGSRRRAALTEVTAAESLHTAGAAIAELQVPRIGLDVPVFPNTLKMSLNRGAGWIAGTADPSGRNGTTGIAAHRDRFFRSLKNITRGDEIVLTTRETVQTFIVDGIAIVAPNNPSLLRDGTRRSLALVTCYPFSYVGPAPRRFIVHAQLKQDIEHSQRSDAEQQLPPERARSLF